MESDLASLRDRACELLSIKNKKNGNAIELIEELMLHQLELEMQNVQLKETHAQLETLSQKYVDLYNLAPIGYFALNASGIIGELNLAGAEILGVEKHLLMDTRFMRYVAADSQRRFSQFFMQIMNHLPVRSCEVKMTKHDGTIFFAKLEGKLLDDMTSDTKQCLIVVSDMTLYLAAAENAILRQK